MMTRTARILIFGGTAMLAAACAERITSTQSSAVLDPAFTTTPLGFESASSSFSTGSTGSEFMPGGHGGEGHRGPNGLLGGFDFMGGGFGDDFLGGPLGGGRPFDHDGRGSSSNCTFAAGTGVVTCAAETHDGITINRTVIYKNAAGTAQASRDSTTNSITSHVDIAGSKTRHEGSVTTIKHASDQTVTGLAFNSTQRTVNGTSAGTENSTGKDSAGTFTASREIGDTTSGIIVPIANGRPTYPTAGSVVRSMRVTLTYTGKAATTSIRREAVTYDGTATAKLVITQDGTTKSCTIPLPHGRPTCS
jgi:hypothetical protein